MGGAKDCCRGCPDRRVGCHGKDPEGDYLCRRWEQWQAEMEARKEACRKDRLIETEMLEYKKEQKQRARRRNGS